VVSALALALAGDASATTYRVLKSFNGPDGSSPQPGLVLEGTTLYGTAGGGGTSSNGVVFKLNTDGSGYAVLRSFNGSDGAYPQGGLALGGNTLYGTTYGGGTSNNGGVVFKVNIDGSGYTVLRSFSSGDGFRPNGFLVLAAGTLFGTASGSSPLGNYVAIFKMNTDGSDYALIATPYHGTVDPVAGALVLADGTLYGTAGDVMFKMNTGGSGYDVIHSFVGTDGVGPNAGLLLDGSTLYGTTLSGGSCRQMPNDPGCGVVFKANTNGSGYGVLYNLPGGAGGDVPQGGLVLAAAGTLCGATSQGGQFHDFDDTGGGLIFTLKTDGSGCGVVKSFIGPEGRVPNGSLTSSGAMLYGTTQYGGDLYQDGSLWSGAGVVFALDWRAATPPCIAVGPLSQAAAPGGSVLFSVTAANLEPVTYQWVFNGTNVLDGATKSILALANIQPAQAGAYSVILANEYGAVTSAPVVLDVIQPGTTSVASCTEVALLAALAGPGPVKFTCDGALMLSNAITIAADAVLDGTGHQVTLSGGGAVRPLCVASNATLTLLNLTIAEGVAVDGQGGAILIANGALNATNCVFLSNLATNAGPGPSQGGAIFSASGRVALDHCTFAGNVARGSDATSNSTNYAGAGGAVYSAGLLRANGCTFVYNSTLGGKAYYYGPGSAGTGGALCNAGLMEVSGSTFASNSVTGGQSGWPPGTTPWAWDPEGGTPGASLPGGAGLGGGFYNAGTASVSGCTFIGNLATGGAGGAGEPAGGDGGVGGDGEGGALFGSTVTVALNNTFVWNQEVGGAGGGGGYSDWGYPQPGGNGGVGGYGGGAVCGLCFVTNCTLASNSAIGGAAGRGGEGPTNGYPAIPGDAGGPVSAASLVNTLLAGNLPASGRPQGTIDTNRNLWADNAAGLTGPLADNGGPTLTMALLPGSPAIGAADSASAPPADQRGFPRPSGSADIGAYAFGYPPVLAAASPPEGGVDIAVSGRASQLCWLLASPDLVNWTAIATNAFSPSGTFLFHDPAEAGQTQRFYRAVMP
jgi:uncharacterized repeat protein (TIGR03803 family)